MNDELDELLAGSMADARDDVRLDAIVRAVRILQDRGIEPVATRLVVQQLFDGKKER